MDIVNDVKLFIRQTIEEKLEYYPDKEYFIEWDEDDFLPEDMKYITPEMGKIDTEEKELFHESHFNSYNDNYTEFVCWNGRPPYITEYHQLIKETSDEFGITPGEVFGENAHDTMEGIICMLSLHEIRDYNENERKEQVREQIEERKNAILTIQKAFREYRYKPYHKFCKIVQMRNMLNDGLIEKLEFEKYLDERKIEYI